MDAATSGTADPAWRIDEIHVDSPERDMTEVALGQSIAIVTRSSANTTARVVAKIRFNGNK